MIDNAIGYVIVVKDETTPHCVAYTPTVSHLRYRYVEPPYAPTLIVDNV